MIHFNYDRDQQTFGDTVDPRLEQILKHHPKFPLAFWSFCDRKQGVDACAIGQGPTTETVGIHDTTIDTLAIDNERSYLHIYDNAYVNSIKMTAGILHVMKGGYVGFLDIQGPSEIHITGHVGVLSVDKQAQVFLYKGAYVDSLCTYGNGSLVRIYKGASVYRLNIQNHAKVMLEGKWCVNKCVNGEKDIIPFIAPREKPAILKVRITFQTHDDLVRFCKDVTENMTHDGRLHVNDDIWLAMIDDCTVYDSYTKKQECVDTVEFSADAINDNETVVILAVTKWLRDNYSCADGGIDFWYKGQFIKCSLDNVIQSSIGAGVGEPVEYGKLIGLVKADGSINMAMVRRSLEVLADDTTAEGVPHRTHDMDDK